MKNKQFSPVAIELTDKKYKKMIIVANVLLFASVMLGIFTFTDAGKNSIGIGAGMSTAFIIFIASFVLYYIARFLGWWNNG